MLSRVPQSKPFVMPDRTVFSRIIEESDRNHHLLGGPNSVAGVLRNLFITTGVVAFGLSHRFKQDCTIRENCLQTYST